MLSLINFARTKPTKIRKRDFQKLCHILHQMSNVNLLHPILVFKAPQKQRTSMCRLWFSLLSQKNNNKAGISLGRHNDLELYKS